MNISISMLCGGRGTRMGGKDKGLIHVQGEPLVLRHYHHLQHLSDDILININRNFELYRALLPQCRLVADEHQDFAGPLAGIYSSLLACKYPYLLTVPCDLLALPEQCAQQLYQSLSNNLLDKQPQVAYAVINNQPVYPLCLLHKSQLAVLQEQLQSKQFTVWRYLQANKAVAVNFVMPPPHPLNLNSVEDLKASV